MPKINFFQILCSLIIGLLRPFSVVLEMFCHEEVGERYPGFASVAALLTLLGWCFFSDDVFPLHVLMLAFVVRLIMHRVMAIRHRLRGGGYVASRSPGRPLVARVIPQLPEQVLVWLEPLALLLVSAVMCFLSSSLGNYLLCGSMAWLAIVIVRTLSAYNRMLDLYDADPQAATAPMLGRLASTLSGSASSAVNWPASTASGSGCGKLFLKSHGSRSTGRPAAESTGDSTLAPFQSIRS